MAIQLLTSIVLAYIFAALCPTAHSRNVPDIRMIEVFTPISKAPAAITAPPATNGTPSSCVPYQCNIFYQVSRSLVPS